MAVNENPLYKKAYFQCAKRAILENEVFMKSFMEEMVKDKYDDEKLLRLNDLLTNMYDNDMFDLIINKKTPENFKDIYDYEICCDIKRYAEEVKVKQLKAGK